MKTIVKNELYLVRQRLYKISCYNNTYLKNGSPTHSNVTLMDCDSNVTIHYIDCDIATYSENKVEEGIKKCIEILKLMETDNND